MKVEITIITNTSTPQEWQTLRNILDKQYQFYEYCIKEYACKASDRIEPYDKSTESPYYYEAYFKLEWWEAVSPDKERSFSGQPKYVEFIAKDVASASSTNWVDFSTLGIEQVRIYPINHLDSEGKVIMNSSRGIAFSHGAIVLNIHDEIYIECQELEIKSWFFTKEEGLKQWEDFLLTKKPPGNI